MKEAVNAPTMASGTPIVQLDRTRPTPPPIILVQDTQANYNL